MRSLLCLMATPMVDRGSQAMPHGDAVRGEGQLEWEVMGEHGYGIDEKSETKHGSESFPIVYRRRFARGEASTDPKAPRPAPVVRDESWSADQTGGKSLVVLQRGGSASGVMQKQFTLEQFWRQPGTKPVNRRAAENCEVGRVQPRDLFETNSIARQTPVKSPIKRKRVARFSTVVGEGDAVLDKVRANGKKQMRRPSAISKADQNVGGEVPLPAGEVLSKRRRVGRPVKEGVKRRVERRVRPAKRPKLVLGANCKLEVVKDLEEPNSEPQLVEVSEPRPQLEVRESPAANSDLQFEDMDSPPQPHFPESSSSETETDDDLSARMWDGHMSRLQEQHSNEATESETATETDSDLPRIKGQSWAKQCEEEDDDTDGEGIPIDLNVLPEVLMSAKSRKKRRPEGQRNGTQKPRRPALKRVEIHQQLQPLDQKWKAVQTNQIVKSLWPIPHQPIPQVAHAEEDIVDPVSSNPGNFVPPQHLQSPLPPRKQDTHPNGLEEGQLREVQRVSDPVSNVLRIRVVQPKMPELTPGQGLQGTRLEKLKPSMPVLQGCGGAHKRLRETRSSSSSEETESDTEQKVGGPKVVGSHPRVISRNEFPGGLRNGIAPRGAVSGVLQLRGLEKCNSGTVLKQSSCPPVVIKAIQGNLYAASQQQWQGTPKKVDQGRKGSRVADSSEDSETESDKEIVGLGVNRPRHIPQLQKPMQGGLVQQNGQGGKVSGFLKARAVGNPEVHKNENSPSLSPMSFHGRSAGSLPVKSPGTGLHVADVGSTAPTTKKHSQGGRKISQKAKIIRSPQARKDYRVGRERGVSRFLPSGTEKKRRGKKIGQFHIHGLESAACRGREHEGINGSQNIPETVAGGLHTPLMRSPAPKGNSQGEAISVATPEAGVGVKQRTKIPGRIVPMGEPSENRENDEVQRANVLSKMTPRTRKLTFAMQKFVTQKANRRQWREINLSNVHPTALIGRTCKIYWPLDDEWYPGVIHDYHPQSKKHRIDYQDDEKEMAILSNERVKLKLSPEEWVELENSTGEHLPKKPNPEELAAIAAGLEDHQGQLGHGDLVWAKVKGYPMWPAFVMDEEHASACGMEPAKQGMLPLQFFGSYDHCRFSDKKVVVFSKGLMLKFHNKCKRVAFEQGLEEVERYLKECRLPESMAHLLDDSVGDGVHGAIERQRQEIEENWPEPDEQECRVEVEDSKRTVRKGAKRPSTLPLHLGALTVLSLGKVVRDSEHFHDQQYIWPEGYTAIRKFPSTRDPDICVDYKMQVVRNPCLPSLPMFRVSPADETPIEGATPFGCWKKVFQKLRKAQEKLGKSTSTIEEKRKQFRSAAHMFGFSNPRVSKLIQALPNARACTKFTNWSVNPPTIEGAEVVLPVGYKAVDIAWKHLDRCMVCYLDEEYVDNLLLQCDKCRIMVHMNCYGEVEPPDGDLWLCTLCRPEAPRYRPPCCLCPVTGGALKETTDGRWAHLMCAMWIPETCLVDVKRMEPVDGINAISKERWRLTCSICKVPYGACIQCTVNNCRVAFHPLCARSAGLCMEVLEEKRKGDGESDLRLLAYCRKHRQATSQTCEVIHPAQQARTDCLSYQPPKNTSGCARSEAYNAAARRGRREPEALAAALAKRLFVENLPFRVTGCRQNPPPKEVTLGSGGSLWSFHWEATRGGGGGAPGASPAALPAPKSGEDIEPVLSMSDKFRRMRSSLSQRLVFGKSAIHGMGVFTKQVHRANDMVIEYAGEVVRPIIADIRERRCYDSLVGAGTYMFRIDDERVVDATHAGSIAHLINHSCEPNCYSRTVTASGEDRIIIFAKRDIELGEELTYDYRFMSKDELLTCYCGCAGCRGSVNVVDGDGDSTKLLVPVSELIKLPATTRGHSH